MTLRVQTNGIKAEDAVRMGLEDLKKINEHVMDVFNNAIKEYEENKWLAEIYFKKFLIAFTSNEWSVELQENSKVFTNCCAWVSPWINLYNARSILPKASLSFSSLINSTKEQSNCVSASVSFLGI